MPRPRKLSHELVLSRCVPVFWQKGYEATSMRDIEMATQLTPGSLYHAFGSKQSLFREVLRHYLDTVIAERIKRYLQEPTSGARQGIRDFLVSLVVPPESQMHKQACLLVKTAFELGPDEPALQPVIQAGFGRIEQALGDAIERGIAHGELGRCEDTTKIARQLALTMPGLLMAHRHGVPAGILEQQVDWLLAQWW